MARPPYSSDVSVMLRGLGRIGSSAIELKGKELNRFWTNSSLRLIPENFTSFLKENSKNSSFSQVDVSANVKEMSGRVYVVAKSIQAYINEIQGVSSQSTVIDDMNDNSNEMIEGITDNPSGANFLNDLNAASSLPGATFSNQFSDLTTRASSDIVGKLKNIEPLLEKPSTLKGEVSDEQLDAISQKLKQIQEAEYIQDYTAFEEMNINNQTPTTDPKYTQANISSSESHASLNILPKKSFSHGIPKPIPKLISRKPLAKEKAQSTLSSDSQARKVPQSRLSRLASFGSLAAGLGMGTLAEMTRRSLGYKNKNSTGAILDASPFLTEANAKRIVDTLCKVRGAALKVGQMLSIQDNSLVNPVVLKMFERVRQSADFMPTWQLERTLIKEFGDDWRNRMTSFDDKPFAAASIGQVHQATLHDGRPVAMKIQYPGVAQGIESDINNLISTLNVAKILPEGMFIDSVIEVAKKELRWECDYNREKACTKRFKCLLAPYSDYYVPEAIDELSSKQVFTTELVDGIAVDKCVNLDQETRNHISLLVLKLCMMELFEFGFMQTDPNWSNFLYNQDTRQLALLDFGACREFDKSFVDKYINVILGAAQKDREKVYQYSKELGFLTGYEPKVMINAHVDAVMILGEAFQKDELFDFGSQNTTKKIQKLIPVMLSHRMCPPPEESYSLHRKMSGSFLLASKLGAVINCKPILDQICLDYTFGDSFNRSENLNDWG